MDLPNSQIEALKKAVIQLGSIILAPKAGVDHKKMYVVCGMSGNRICVCSVLINSEINKFIKARPKLLALQIEIHKKDYPFLKHTSHINCSNQEKCNIDYLTTADCQYLGDLQAHHLAQVQKYVLASGQLTPDEVDLYFDNK